MEARRGRLVDEVHGERLIAGVFEGELKIGWHQYGDIRDRAMVWLPEIAVPSPETMK
jgi:hypothetical protein